jgi:hypothetical protein
MVAVSPTCHSTSHSPLAVHAATFECLDDVNRQTGQVSPALGGFDSLRHIQFLSLIRVARPLVGIAAFGKFVECGSHVPFAGRDE